MGRQTKRQNEVRVECGGGEISGAQGDERDEGGGEEERGEGVGVGGRSCCVSQRVRYTAPARGGVPTG